MTSRRTLNKISIRVLKILKFQTVDGQYFKPFLKLKLFVTVQAYTIKFGNMMHKFTLKPTAFEIVKTNITLHYIEII